MDISANYRKLEVHEVADAVQRYGDAWKDETIPKMQYELAVKPELEKFRRGGRVAPFDALLQCLYRIPFSSSRWSILDVGASSAFYSEVIEIGGLRYRYHAIDFSPAFQRLAAELYPHIPFDVGDARELPYPDGTFDVVLSGACMIHTPEYPKIVAEATRVAKSCVILHRTPVLTERPTEYWVKDAYGIPCVEIHFNEAELFGLFEQFGLTRVWTTDVFFDEVQGFGHREYLLRKEPVVHQGL